MTAFTGGLITGLLAVSLMGIAFIAGLLVGITFVLRDAQRIAHGWRLRALVEPGNSYTLTACADELDRVAVTHGARERGAA